MIQLFLRFTHHNSLFSVIWGWSFILKPRYVTIPGYIEKKKKQRPLKFCSKCWSDPWEIKIHPANCERDFLLLKIEVQKMGRQRNAPNKLDLVLAVSKDYFSKLVDCAIRKNVHNQSVLKRSNLCGKSSRAAKLFSKKRRKFCGRILPPWTISNEVWRLTEVMVNHRWKQY